MKHKEITSCNDSKSLSIALARFKLQRPNAKITQISFNEGTKKDKCSIAITWED